MNRDDGRYLSGLVRRTTQNVSGIVTESLGNNEYMVRLNHTNGEVRAGLGQAGISLAIGQAVVLTSVDATGRAPGAGYVISDYPTLGNKNAGVITQPFAATVAKNAETLVKISPTSVSLTAGGAAATILAYGTNLSSAAVYGHVSIVNDVAQVTTATLITLQVKANGGCPAGRYDLTVAGVTIENFFEVS